MNKAIKLILFFGGLSFLFALIYRTGFNEIVRTIAQAKLPFAFLGVSVYLMAIFSRSLKWFLLAKTVKNQINYKQFIPLYLVNSLMGNLTPLKSGETTTPFLFKKYLKIPVGQGFSIVILDRFFELIIFILIFFFAVFYILNSGIQSNLILSFFRGVLIALFLLLAVLVTIIASKRIALKIVGLLRILKFIERELYGFYDALSLFGGAYKFIILLTLMAWFFEFSAYYLIFSSILSAPFINIAVAQIMAAAASLATFIPGGMGMAEVSTVYILGLFGHPSLLATSGAVLIRLFSTSALLITGLVGSLLIGKENRNPPPAE